MMERVGVRAEKTKDVEFVCVCACACMCMHMFVRTYVCAHYIEIWMGWIGRLVYHGKCVLWLFFT